MKQALAGNMLLALIALLSCSAVLDGKDTKIVDKLKGVANSKVHLYERKGPNWTCLDGSAIIPYEAINDEYCDCADGSDEPGTSACPNGRFHCKNVGHIPASISSSRVNDGVCDPECCDGSDEYDGKIECPDVCKEVGMEYRKKMNELSALRAQGTKKKLEYIDYGKKLKEERKINLERLKGELSAAKLKVEEKEAALKKVKQSEASSDSSNKGHLERIKKYQERIKRLRDRVNVLHEDVETLLRILKDMKDGHNQNYHDMAVKSAITAYDEFLEEYNRESNDDVDNILDSDKDEEYETISEEYEVPQIQDPELQAATDARNQAEEERKTLENKIDDLNNKLSNDYGPQEEFSKLDEECFEQNSGEYTYTVCMFGAATQKSNKDYASTHLGNFGKWIGAESKEDSNYYTKQIYENGSKCWNGPERSVKLHLECGIENKIISVSEPEKCEYHIKMKTPAICPDKVHTGEDKIHDEL